MSNSKESNIMKPLRKPPSLSLPSGIKTLSGWRKNATDQPSSGSTAASDSTLQEINGTLKEIQKQLSAHTNMLDGIKSRLPYTSPVSPLSTGQQLYPQLPPHYSHVEPKY